MNSNDIMNSNDVCSSWTGADAESILCDAEALQGTILADDVVNVIPLGIVILNRERQVVTTNGVACRIIRLGDPR
jgi:hypothetical protein